MVDEENVRAPAQSSTFLLLDINVWQQQHNIQSQEEDWEGMIEGAAFGTAVAVDSSLSV